MHIYIETRIIEIRLLNYTQRNPTENVPPPPPKGRRSVAPLSPPSHLSEAGAEGAGWRRATRHWWGLCLCFVGRGCGVMFCGVIKGLCGGGGGGKTKEIRWRILAEVLITNRILKLQKKKQKKSKKKHKNKNKPEPAFEESHHRSNTLTYL